MLYDQFSVRILTVVVSLVTAALAAGTAAHGGSVIHVPNDFPTIQQAIDAAADGDEIVIAAGTYSESLDLLGKSLTLTGDAGAEQTIIDASGLNDRIMRIESAAEPGVALHGLTLTGGAPQEGSGAAILVTDAALSITDCHVVDNSGGSAIHASASSVTVHESHFENNDSHEHPERGGAMSLYSGSTLHAEDSTFLNNASAQGLGGGAIFAGGAHEVVIDHCVFEANEGWHGGALLLLDVPYVTVRDSQFIGNEAVPDTDGGSSWAGAISVRAAVLEDLGDSLITIEDCEFIDNEATYGGALGAYTAGSSFDEHITPVHVSACTFAGNHAEIMGAVFHAGFWIPEIHFVDCEMDGNTAGEGGSLVRILGGEWPLSERRVTWRRCRIANNSVPGGTIIDQVGGGVALGDNLLIENNQVETIFRGEVNLHLLNSTIAHNDVTSLIDIDEDAQAQIYNSIAWPFDGEPFIGGGEVVASHSLLPGYKGDDPTVIGADPEFVNPAGGDYRLSAGSPAIGIGTNGVLDDERHAHDLAGQPRIVNCAVDLGAYEYQGGIDPVVIHVPDDVGTIQEAIVMARGCATIHVAPGEYNESIELLGRPMNLLGAGPDETIIDRQGADGSVVIGRHPSTMDTVIEGFTFTGGTGTDPELPLVPQGTQGGGVLLYRGAHATMRDCAIRNNTVERSGGGVAVFQGGVLLEEVVITENEAYRYGSGISVWISTLDMRDSRVETNTTSIGPGAITVRYSWQQGKVVGPWYGQQRYVSLESTEVVANHTKVWAGPAIYSNVRSDTFEAFEINNCLFAHDESAEAVIHFTGTHSVVPSIGNTVFCPGGMAEKIAGEWIDAGGNEFLDECPGEPTPGDLTGDGTVGGADLGILLSEWGPCDDCDDCPADLTGDCEVGGADLGVLLSNWTS